MIPSIRQQLRRPPPSHKTRRLATRVAALWAASTVLWCVTQYSPSDLRPTPPLPAKPKPERSREPLHAFHVTANGRLLRKFATLEEAAAHRREIFSAHRITTLTCSCGTHEN